MNRFDTLPILHKVKSHSINHLNAEADILSKQARLDPTLQNEDIPTYKIGSAKQRDVHVYMADIEIPHRLDSYPRTLISRRIQDDLKIANTKRLERRWVPEYSLPEYISTTTALTLALDRDDHLDCSNFQVHSFRIGCINKNLQTLDKLETYNFWNRTHSNCVMCTKNKIEDQSHIFECQHVKDNMADLNVNTANYARQELQKRCSKKNVPYYPELEEALMSVKNTFFQETTDIFLSSAEARGLISQEIKDLAAESIENISLKIKLPSKGWLLSLISAAWTRALYEFFWKPRTCILFRENHEATNAKEKERLRVQRDINAAKAKAKANARAKTQANALLKKPNLPN
jgi:hypothetical protein